MSVNIEGKVLSYFWRYFRNSMVILLSMFIMFNSWWCQVLRKRLNCLLVYTLFIFTGFLSAVLSFQCTFYFKPYPMQMHRNVMKLLKRWTVYLGVFARKASFKYSWRIAMQNPWIKTMTAIRARFAPIPRDPRDISIDAAVWKQAGSITHLFDVS